jgi:hypothetical protein
MRPCAAMRRRSTPGARIRKSSKHCACC